MPFQQYLNQDQLANIFILESIKGFGPQKFKDLHRNNITASRVLDEPQLMSRFGKRGLDFCAQIMAIDDKYKRDAVARAKRQLEVAQDTTAVILTYEHPHYPRVLYDSNYPVPVLYARGDLNVLNSEKCIACVGTRNIRLPYNELHKAFATKAVEMGFTVVSGFATGADIIGHLVAERSHGKTIGVMPSGLDRPFPPEHKDIWRRFISIPGVVFVSEFGFGVGANALNLRKRNKMIAGMSNALLVSQSAEDGGAMNAFRASVEQKKPIATFQSDGTKETSGNDLIAGASTRVNSTVFDFNETDSWDKWLQTL